MRALPDVNVLIALLERDHEHHGVASRWLEDNMAHGWATCAISKPHHSTMVGTSPTPAARKAPARGSAKRGAFLPAPTIVPAEET